MIRVAGFTGTIKGMTAAQGAAFKALLVEHGVKDLHHGDCLGADAEAHRIARDLGLAIVIHPPSDPKSRAFMDQADAGNLQVRSPKPYLKRNKDIVLESEALFATPRGFAPMVRSGTWATVRAAGRAGKPVYVIWPDGVVALL